MKILQGLKILDFTTLLPGPYATLMLGDMGAEIIKISSPDKPDIVADYPPYTEDENLSANQAWLGRTKKKSISKFKNSRRNRYSKKISKRV